MDQLEYKARTLAYWLFGEHFLALLGVVLFFSVGRREREFEDLADGLHVVDSQVFQLLGREIFLNIGLVFSRAVKATG